MSSLNRWQGLGNLGKDPEVKQVGTGEVANFSIACKESWNDANGQKQEKTEWVNIVAWKGLAGIAKNYLRKGSQVYVEGRLQTRKWTDQSGADRYTTEVVATNIQMLGKREDAPAPQQQQQQQSNPNTYNGPVGGTDPTDDLPF